MLKEYVRKQIIKFIENEINIWISNMNISRKAYADNGIPFVGSTDQIYYSHVISAYEFLLMQARTY